MATTREVLEAVSANVSESAGVRTRVSVPLPVPAASPREAGRRPDRNSGRIRIDCVIPDPDQPRQEFDEDALDRLAESIRSHGQLSPIRIRWSEEHASWVIVFGERRWQAARRAGLSEIDCVFLERELTPTEILEQQLIENCLREDLQPIEEARAFSRLMGINGWTGKQVADALQIPASKVSRTLALLKLPADVQRQITDGLIPARTAYELSKLKSEKTIRRLASEAAAGALTTDAASTAVRQRSTRPRRKPRVLRQTFASSTGWKITAVGRSQSSYHELAAALEEALEEVHHRIANGRTLF